MIRKSSHRLVSVSIVHLIFLPLHIILQPWVLGYVSAAQNIFCHDRNISQGSCYNKMASNYLEYLSQSSNHITRSF